MEHPLKLLEQARVHRGAWGCFRHVKSSHLHLYSAFN